MDKIRQSPKIWSRARQEQVSKVDFQIETGLPTPWDTQQHHIWHVLVLNPSHTEREFFVDSLLVRIY